MPSAARPRPRPAAARSAVAAALELPRADMLVRRRRCRSSGKCRTSFRRASTSFRSCSRAFVVLELWTRVYCTVLVSVLQLPVLYSSTVLRVARLSGGPKSSGKSHPRSRETPLLFYDVYEHPVITFCDIGKLTPEKTYRKRSCHHVNPDIVFWQEKKGVLENGVSAQPRTHTIIPALGARVRSVTALRLLVDVSERAHRVCCDWG